MNILFLSRAHQMSDVPETIRHSREAFGIIKENREETGMQDENLATETMGKEKDDMGEKKVNTENVSEGKKINKKSLIVGGIGIVTAIAIVVMAVFGVRYLKSDAYCYRSMMTEKLPLISTEEELRELREGDECYLIVSDMDAYEKGYIGYLVDDKRHDTETQVILEIPVWAHWIAADEIIAKAKYVTRDRTDLREGEGKKNFYRFELMEVAALDQEYQICSDITKVNLVRRKTDLDIGDKVSVALIGSEHGSSINYNDEIYYVFNYVDIDYDYEEMDEICKVQSDKKFIVSSGEDVFHINPSIDIDWVREMREGLLEEIAITLVDAKVIDITPDEYYVLEPYEISEREQYIVGIDTDQNAYVPIVEDDTNIDTFDKMIDWLEKKTEEEDGMRLDYRILLFADREKTLAYIDEMKEKLGKSESKTEEMLAGGSEELLAADSENTEAIAEEAESTEFDEIEDDEDYIYYFIQYVRDNDRYLLYQYSSYEDAVMDDGEDAIEIAAEIPNYVLMEGTIFRCKPSDIEWDGDTAIITELECMN